MSSKKDFTKADGAIDKFFIPPQSEATAQATNALHDAHATNNTNISQDIHVGNDNNVANISKVTNKSKHFNERGKRAERFGLLLDEQLKNDLKYLSMAKGSKSVNDLIVTILLEYVGREENQKKLEQYLKLLQS